MSEPHIFDTNTPYTSALESTNIWATESSMHGTQTSTMGQITNDDTDMIDETAVTDLVVIQNAEIGGAVHEDRATSVTGRTSGASGSGVSLRRRHDGGGVPNNEAMHTPKRVAVSGPNQRVIDDLRQREEITRQRAVHHGVQIQSQRREIQLLQNELHNRSYQNALEGELESQMVDQIIQFEKQIQTLSTRNAELTSIVQNGGLQLQELQHRNDETQRQLDDLAGKHAQEKERQANEVLALRQRLQAAETARSTQSASHSATESVTSPRVMRNIFTRGTPASIGIVPLRPLPSPQHSNASAAQTQETETIDLNTPDGVSNVTTIVKEVLNQLNITRAVVTETNSRNLRRRSARTQNQHAKAVQRRTLTKDQDLAWMGAVRNFWKTTFNITSFSDFGEYEPAPANQVKAFEAGPNGYDGSNTLDFQKGYERSRWNKGILDRLCTQILEERNVEGNWGLPDVSNAYILSLLANQLKRSREAWSLVQARPNFAENCVESAEDIIHRVTDYTATRLEAIGSRARRERKYQRRMKATEKIILLKSETNAPDLDTWNYFRDLLSRLSVDGMSSEEESVEKIGSINVPVFRVKLCVWRNPAVRDYFKFIDSESQNPVIRPTRGSKLQPRIMTNEPGHTQAPQNLPENLFDVEWLRSVKESKGQRWIEDELKVSRDVFDLLQFVAP